MTHKPAPNSTRTSSKDPINKLLASMTLGPIATYRNLALAPIESEHQPHTPYLGFKQAWFSGHIAADELSQEGVVAEVKVDNAAKTGVLLLDGEELVGMKQNRVFATTVLIPAHSSLTIPVSCSEAGRWSDRSAKTMASDALMAQSLRVKKMMATERNPHASGSPSRRYRVDQDLVWAEILDLQERLGVRSPTEALRDLYRAKKAAIEQYLEALSEALVGQGRVVWRNGRLAGMEWRARPEVYATVCTQLVRSYILDALRQHEGTALPAHQETAYRFIERCQSARSRGMDSVGLGRDIRYTGEDGFVGSCLVHQDEVIHAGFYPAELSPRQPSRSRSTR